MKKIRFLTFTAATVILAFYVFFRSVNLNPLYPESAIFWAVVISVYILIWALFHFGEFTFQKLGDIAAGGKPFDYVPKKKFPKAVKILIAAPWAFLAVMMVLSSPIISWGAYRDQLGEPEFKEFSNDVQAVDMSQVPIIDKDLAWNLADKKLGERPSLGSQVRLGEPTIQMVNGKLLWALPLQHSGFFKWITNLSGSAGYITVSATNMNDVQYVDSYKVKIQPYSYLLHDLTRNVRFTAAPFTGITDYSFELDDSGQPYWVVSTYKNQRGFALPEATGAIIVNASTGTKEEFSIEELPDWVDRVQPEAFVLNQITNQGSYVHGIFNFADKDKFRPSAGHNIVYNNGNCYLFTGLTSVGQDESAIGFVMVDMVTKQPVRYQINGATETLGQRSAQGKVQHLAYTASFPIIINMDGQPTYFMTLKDNAGLIKQYAFVSVTNYSSVGVGESIGDAMRDYAQVLRNDSSSISLGNMGTAQSATGKIVRISAEQAQNAVLYKMIVDSMPDMIFVSESSISQELAITRDGDEVTVEYSDIGTGIADVTAFDNHAFAQRSSKTDMSAPAATTAPPEPTESAAPETPAAPTASPTPTASPKASASPAPPAESGAA